MLQTRIYLGWQCIADGRMQIRKWSPDNTNFLGYEKQKSQALGWLQANGEPTFPECLDKKLPTEPYCIKYEIKEE